MKHLITILLFILVGSGFSQNYKVIVVDVSNKVIPFVNTQVTYEFNNQKKELQTLSNGEGVLFIDTNWINVKLKLKHVSYQTKFSTVNSKNKKVMMYLDNTELTTFVVTGQYSSSSVDESVHKVKVIDSKRIEAQGAVNLQELMEQEMNVRVSQDNTLGSSMSIQGLSGENVKILIDGVPVVGRMNGSIDLSQINLNNIERVEIVEGPLSVNYGTNALAGTINLITKKNKKKFGARAEGYYETIGQYNFNASVDLAIKSHAFTFSGGRNFFDGYSEVDTSRVQQWRPKEQLFGAIKYSNTYKKITYQFTSDVFEEELISRGEPRSPYKETAFDDYFTTTRFSNSLNLTYKANKNSVINILGGYNYYKRIKTKYLKDLVTIDYQIIDDLSSRDTSVFDLVFSRGTYSFSKDSSKLNYQLGYDINVEANKGKRINDGRKEIGDYAIFGSLEYRPNTKTVIRPGLRYSYNTAYETPLIPSFNVKYDWSKHLTSRLSWGKGFRAPSLKELHFLFVDLNHNILGNKNLVAENSDNFMLQFNYKRGIKRGVYNFGLSGFYNAVNNQISLVLRDATEQLYTYTNIGKFFSQGINLNSGFKYKTYRTDIGFSWVGRYNNEYTNHSSLDKFLYTPEIMASFGYEVKEWQSTFNLFYKYTGRVLGFVESEFDEVSQYEIEAYSMMDVSLIKYFFKKKLSITLGAKNLFDVGNINSNQLTGGVHSGAGNNIPVAWGRTYFTRLVINL
tara:strand:+ start:4975 stop:7182 length:2208 start_codon:yes stop_codon:yes gene_type:complete